MNVSELISKLASMPLSSEVRLVRVVTEKDFKEADEVEKSEEGKVVVFKDPICEVERMKDTVLVYSINS